MWSIVEAVGTSAAALFAGVQIWLSRKEANARTVFEHLREIDQRVQNAWAGNIQATQQELLKYYRGQTEELSQPARNYLALLNALDVLAFAIDKKLVSGHIANEYVRTLVSPNVLSQTFIKSLQECCGDAGVYEHLYRYFTQLQVTNRFTG